MRAMILAAGLGTRLRPLTRYRAKPALPIRGRPVISLLLEFLCRHGVDEVMINLHYLPQSIRSAVEGDSPPAMEIHWSEEQAPLGTGGGIRQAADFLAGSPDCIVLAGDMLLDLDLRRLLERHRESHREATLVLRDDPRGAVFGTIGIDAGGLVTRIGTRWNCGTEARSGLFTGVRFFSRRVFDGWPESTVFEDLRDWLIPGIEAGRIRVGAEFVRPEDSVWEPVGTLDEYLAVNLTPPCLPSLGGSVEHWSGDVRITGSDADVILDASSEIGPDARLERTVVWEDEHVPSGFHAHDGVFTGGRFHDCGGASTTARQGV